MGQTGHFQVDIWPRNLSQICQAASPSTQKANRTFYWEQKRPSQVSLEPTELVAQKNSQEDL